jgi:hypothetical protein
MWDIDELQIKKPKIYSVEDYTPVEDLKIWDSTRIYDSDRISGATDKGMTTKAHNVDTPKVYLGKGL